MILINDRRVVDFVAERIGGCPALCTAVGYEKDGAVVAGALYERCNGHNVFFHGASDESRRWATKGFIKALCEHPFVTLGVPRMSTVVAASNVSALAFDATLGFREEARLVRAAHDGSDSIYLVMFKDKCKWLNL